jgi:hypothetical protein
MKLIVIQILRRFSITYSAIDKIEEIHSAIEGSYNTIAIVNILEKAFTFDFASNRDESRISSKAAAPS